MRDDTPLDELPEAVPLHRVAPFWRLFGIVAAIAAFTFLFVGLILGIVLVNIANRPPVTAAAPAPVYRAPPMAPAVAVAVGSVVEDDAPADTSNLPYPVKADLSEGDSYEPAEENPLPPAKPRATARERFLDKGTDVWKLKGHLPDHLVISADGEHMAYIAGGNLTAGPIGSQRQIVGAVMQPVPVPVMPGRARVSYPATRVAFAEENGKLLGSPAWSPDKRYVYCADARGHLRRYDLHSGRSDGTADSEVLPFDGESPAPLPNEPEKLVFVRAQPRPKLDARGQWPLLDPTEVVLGDLTTKELRVLVPASASTWRHLAVSPDGKRLALVSDHGHEGERSQQLRVFVLDLAGGEPKSLSPPASQAGPIAWTADGQALVYARSQDPPPADYWESEPAGTNGTLDLYQYDFATNQETRLSRGGGCFSPSVTSNGDLFYLAVQDAAAGLLLRRVPLAAVREFAALEPQGIVRDAAAWTRLLQDVLEESKVVASLDGSVVPPAKLAESFHRLYRKQFQADPPSTLKGFGRQRRELQKLNLPPSLRPALTLILGAVEGEYLVRRHGARWHLTQGPLLPSDEPAAEPMLEAPFSTVANPFAAVNDWARQSGHPRTRDRDGAAADESLVALLRRAEGRTLVLTNDPAAARTIVAELTDPDFDRALELLQQGKADSAEQLFQALLKQKRHEHNMHLALRIGNLLFEAKRLPALQRLIGEQSERPPHDARKFNFLGLSLLEAEPRQAIDAFKNALRCDLRFEPAYLNLAQAYQQANDWPSARMCLQRYLALMPDGMYAVDARRRLAAVDPLGK